MGDTSSRLGIGVIHLSLVWIRLSLGSLGIRRGEV